MLQRLIEGRSARVVSLLRGFRIVHGAPHTAVSTRRQMQCIIDQLPVTSFVIVMRRTWTGRVYVTPGSRSVVKSFDDSD